MNDIRWCPWHNAPCVMFCGERLCEMPVGEVIKKIYDEESKPYLDGYIPIDYENDRFDWDELTDKKRRR